MENRGEARGWKTETKGLIYSYGRILGGLTSRARDPIVKVKVVPRLKELAATAKPELGPS